MEEDCNPIHVIGVGLPRTGTASLKAALEILGFGPCHHMQELFKYPNQLEEFLRAHDGQNVNFRKLLKGYQSIVDEPGLAFYKEIHQMYPQAKLVLTVRDSSEKWFESFSNTVGPFFTTNSYFLTVYWVRLLRLQCILCHKIWKKWNHEFGHIGPDFHDRFNARIISENSDKNLLIFNCKEGWSPLCKFLEVDIPQNVPFPHVNDTQKIKEHISKFKRTGLYAWLVVSMTGSIVTYFLIKLMF